MRGTARVILALLASALLLGSKGNEGCPVPPAPHDPQAVWRSLSLSAEMVAGRRRAAVQPAIQPPVIPQVNFIDASIFGKMAADGVIPTTVAGDEEFLRRVTLDLTGQIPDANAVSAFLADTRPDKRARKIDEMLATEAFVDRWTMWFGDLVQNVRASTNSREYYIGRNAYYYWIRDSIRAAKPYDQMVRELLAGTGDSFESGTANYIVRQLQPNGPPQDTFDNLAAHSVEKFLGVPALCISCHDGFGHLELVNTYLKGKKRSEFWSTAAFFSKTTLRPQPGDPNNPVVRKFIVQDGNPNGAYRLNTIDGNKSPRIVADGQPAVASPAFLLTGEAPRAGEPYRQAYGRILTAHPQFARSTVNMLWKEMFGLGLVEPVNSFDLSRLDANNLPAGATVQPTHPELLEALAAEFIKGGYSLRAILRTMTMSSAYQLSSAYTSGSWNEAWVPYFARHYPQRMMAEMIVDAIARSTNVPMQFNAQGIGTLPRAMQLPDPTEGGRQQLQRRLLDAFVRGNRDDIARSNESSIAQALVLMNDVQVTMRVSRSSPNSTVATALATNDPAAIADRLYLATLSRRPTAAEKELAIDFLRGGVLGERTEDLQFVLLNQLEFFFK